jgi:cytochrome c oxidase subunit 6a
MNKWRTVSYIAMPAVAGFGVYTLANTEHGHGHEHPAYSYLKRRSREQFPWGGDCSLFEYKDECK